MGIKETIASIFNQSRDEHDITSYERAKIKKYFQDHISKDKTHMSQSQFIKLFQEKNPHIDKSSSKQIAKNKFKRANKAANGRLTFDEYLAAYINSKNF
jgi:hypothetical protein